MVGVGVLIDNKEEQESKTESSFNYLRMGELLHVPGLGILREIFYWRYKISTNSNWEEGTRVSKKYLRERGGKIISQAQKIQKGMLEDADVTKWDVSLLANVLQRLDFEAKLDSFKEENRLIQKLADVRNQYSHLPSSSIPVNDFGTMWSNAESALIGLGVRKEEIDGIKQKVIGFERLSAEQYATLNQVQAKTLREAGDEALRANDIRHAINRYSNALKLYGISPIERGILLASRCTAYTTLLEKAKTEGESFVEYFKCALEDGKSSRDHRPRWWEVYFRIGRVYQAVEEWDAAIVAYDHAIRFNPKAVDARNSREICRSAVGKDQEPTYTVASMEKQFDKLHLEIGLDISEKSIEQLMQDYSASTDPKREAVGLIFLAHRLAERIDVEPDYDTASKRFAKAAALGNVEAIYNLGLLHKNGAGVTRDHELAYSMFHQAAKWPASDLVGVAEAQFALGRCFEEGLGKVMEGGDYEEAAEWYKCSSDNGFGPAANNLAFFYMNGLGVERNPERALHYWNLAANRGVDLAMNTLAYYYLEARELEQAELLFQRSVKAGNIKSVMNKDVFQNLIADARKKVDDDSAPKLTIEQLQDLPQFRAQVENCQELNSTANSPKRIPSILVSYWSGEHEIRAKGDQGVMWAKRIASSMACFKKCLKVFNKIENSSPTVSLVSELIHTLGNCLRASEVIVYFSPLQLQYLHGWAKENLLGGNPRLQLSARICLAHCLSVVEPTTCVEFVSEQVRKFSKEIYFWRILASMHGLLGNTNEGIQAACEGLRLYPADDDLLFYKARLLRQAWNGKNKTSRDAAIDAYTNFIANAISEDHYNLPECYYSLAEIEISSTGPNSHLAQSYFLSGRLAESKLLSCFLPYQSKTKLNLEAILSLDNHFEKKVSQAKFEAANPTTKGSHGSCEMKSKFTSRAPTKSETTKKCFNLQKHPRRVEVVLSHRTMLDLLRRDTQALGIGRLAPAKNQSSSRLQLTGLKGITLKDMNPSGDHVYEGYVINLTIMEDCIFGSFPCINTVVKDENHDFQYCFFYNLNREDAVVKKNLTFGSKISVVNPYMQMTVDGEKGIKIDNPKSIFYHGSGLDETVCRFCWAPKPLLKCTRCKRALYCDKVCQKEDWDLLKHKLICVP